MQESKGGRVGTWRLMLCLLHTLMSLGHLISLWRGGFVELSLPLLPQPSPLSFAALLSCGPPHRLGSQSSGPPWVCCV